MTTNPTGESHGDPVQWSGRLVGRHQGVKKVLLPTCNLSGKCLTGGRSRGQNRERRRVEKGKGIQFTKVTPFRKKTESWKRV